jgi:sulfoacetaldehyde dehydrogenase
MNSSYDKIKILIKNAKTSQEEIRDYSQEEIDEVCLSVGWQTYKDDNVQSLAAVAVEETGMGVYLDKIKKHKIKVMGVCRDIIGRRSTGLIESDISTGITKYAKPVGIVGAITPCTNPTATLASNAVSILKGKNAVIFAPHPRAIKSCRLVCKYMRLGLSNVGAPKDLIQFIEEPSIELSQELMRQVDLVVATGGQALVKAAYSSGTPAFGVGAGNAVCIIAEDADLEDSVEKIILSKTFDNSTSCSSDNSTIVNSIIYSQFIDIMCRKGAYLCTDREKGLLEKWVWPDSQKRSLNPKIIAQSPTLIAKGAGFEIPTDTKLIIVEGKKPGKDLYSGEKISPILAVWKYNEFAEALLILDELLEYAGKGHSCGIHTFNQAYIEKLASNIKVSRITVRQAHGPAAGGAMNNGMPSTTTLGCGTWGGNITTENIHWKHFINVTWVTNIIEGKVWNEEDVFGTFKTKHSL